MKKKRARPVPKDIALLHGPTEDGEGARVLRLKDGELYAGEVRPVREGQPVNDEELVRLRPIEGLAPLCEVEVVHPPNGDKGGDKGDKAQAPGPARVATNTYRRNWNTVFGASSKKPRADYSVN